MNRITSIGRFEQVIRKSRFIGCCGPASSEQQARDFIDLHGEAGCRHVCWAWRCGDRVRFDDAGEPGGTAGRPILAALEYFDLDCSVAVVSRFFGGVKLGTGGLARAYGTTAMETLARARVEKIVEKITLECLVPFASARELHQLVERHSAIKLEEHWAPAGLCLTLELAAESSERFSDDLRAATRGQASIDICP